MAPFRVPAMLLVFLVGYGLGAIPLGKYTVDRTKMSTSGFSSGASMATQLHVGYSASFMGVGMIAGNPYYCAQDSLAEATGRCSDNPGNIVISELTTQTTMYASNGDADPTNNMYDARVFILAGTLDTVVLPGVGRKVEEYYQNFVHFSNIQANYTLQAEHTFPTVDYINDCSFLGTPYIGRCNYNAAYEILNHIYGNLVKPAGSMALPGQFYEFDQSQFISAPSLFSMDDVGYVYVPYGCLEEPVNTTACKLHVAIHGCQQGRESVGDSFARNTGYNEIGELNRIIMLYPQAITSSNNNLGCWDWWGYTGGNYATKNANQTLAIWRMVQQIAY